MKQLRQMFLQLSLKRKWALATSSIILLSYLIICVIVYIAVSSWLLVGEQQRAQRTIDDVAGFVQQDGLAIQSLQQQSGLLKSIVEQEETVRIYNYDHIELLRINDRAKATLIALSREDIQAGYVVKQSEQLILYKAVQIGLFEGYAQLIHPLEHMHATLRYILITMIFVGALVMLMTLAATHVLVRYLLRPIFTLSATMAKVRDEGLQAAQPIVYEANDELGQLMTMYEQMIEELEQSFARQQRFVSDASHELRTPIQAIEGYLSLVQRWGKDDPAVLDESIATALSETKRMKHLLEELLKLAKNDPKIVEAVQIEAVLQAVVSELQFVSKPFTWQLSSQGEKQPVYTSPQAVGQIFRNIIENSIRYSANDCHIQAMIHYSDEHVYVQLADNGVGIAKEHLPHIFERFYRVDAARQYEEGSAGLGLSITKALAQKYGIALQVESEIGKGTTFLLRFSLLSAR